MPSLHTVELTFYFAVFVGTAALLVRGRRIADARLQRLAEFFASRGYGSVEISPAEFSYGHPGYEVTFASAKALSQFVDSEDHVRLQDEVAAMHVGRKGFDPARALRIEAA